jgi:hypothetical protein
MRRMPFARVSPFGVVDLLRSEGGLDGASEIVASDGRVDAADMEREGENRAGDDPQKRSGPGPGMVSAVGCQSATLAATPANTR